MHTDTNNHGNYATDTSYTTQAEIFVPFERAMGPGIYCTLSKSWEIPVGNVLIFNRPTQKVLIWRKKVTDWKKNLLLHQIDGLNALFLCNKQYGILRFRYQYLIYICFF